MRFFLLDTNAGVNESPNFQRDFNSDPANNSMFGTISIRRRVQNNSANNLTRLRFRVTDISTFPAPAGITDLRPRSSLSVSVSVPGLGLVNVQGTTMETPPAQPNGGGFNSSLSSGTVSVSPGDGPGILTTTNLQLLASSSLDIEIYGVAAGTEHDRLNVNGPVTLGGALNVTLGIGASQVGDSFRILSNDGSDPIRGSFSGLPQGGTAIIGGYRFRISYTSGGGGFNDVTLIRLAHVNITSNNIPSSGPASVYPSTISMSGITGLISRVTVTLSNFNHSFPDDVDVLLVSPSGKRVVLMSDAGGSTNVTNIASRTRTARPIYSIGWLSDAVFPALRDYITLEATGAL